MHVEPPDGEPTPNAQSDDVDVARLQRLFDIANGPGTPEELQREQEIVAAMVASRTAATREARSRAARA